MTAPARAALVGMLVLGVAAAAKVLLGTPWRTLATPPGGPTRVDPGRDFTAEQIAREDAFHHLIRPGSYAALGLGLAVAGVLGLTPLGARLVGAVARPLGGGWGWQGLLGSLGVSLGGPRGRLPVAPV